MFLRSMLLLGAAASMVATIALPATSGERHRHKRLNRPVAIVKIEFDRNRHRHHRRHHRPRPYGTYSGNVVVISAPRIGTWSYGSVADTLRPAISVPSAKIIDVKAAVESNSACSMEQGVCVIRP